MAKHRQRIDDRAVVGSRVGSSERGRAVKRKGRRQTRWNETDKRSMKTDRERRQRKRKKEREREQKIMIMFVIEFSVAFAVVAGGDEYAPIDSYHRV